MFMNNSKSFIFILWILTCFFLTWCWEMSGEYNYPLSFYWFILDYNWDVDIESVPLKKDDIKAISELYKEVWDDDSYKDSLLVAKTNSKWLGANVFSRENLETLEEQWLTIENVDRTQVSFKKSWERVNAVLAEYEIVEWLVTEVPRLYVSQLFVPKGNDIILMSYITEDKYSRTSASNMFKNIK